MAWFSFHGGHSGEFCRHATGTLEEVLESAVAAGFTAYGVSEHAPKHRDEDLYADEADLSAADTQRSFRRYVERARELRERFADRLEVLIGFEAESVPPDRWPRVMRSLRESAPFDYVVGSVHHVAGWPIDESEDGYLAAAEALGGPRALERGYFAELAELVDTLRPEIVGHFDLVRWIQGKNPEFDRESWPAVERALEAVEANGALLDVNSSPVRKGLGPVYPMPAVLERARALGIRVTLGDDSHGPQQVGAALDQALAAIAAAGFRHVHCLRQRDGAVAVEPVPLGELAPRRGTVAPAST
jgi:histidinol-phosphatase (PHP family)